MEFTLDSVKNTLNIGKILINTLLAVLGVVLILSAQNLIDDYTSAGYMILVTLGSVGVMVALVNILFRSKVEVYTPTGSKIRKLSINFASSNISPETLQRIIDDGKTDEIKRCEKVDSGDVLVEIKYSKDSKFAGYRISKYIPYQYEIITPWRALSPNCVPELKGLSRL